MTETRSWLEARRREFNRREVGAGVLLTVGGVLAVFGLSVVLARLGLYRLQPAAVLAGWVAALAVAGGAYLWLRRRLRTSSAKRLAREVELRGGLRNGAIAGMADAEDPRGSRALAELADGRAVAWLEEHGEDALRPARGEGVKLLRFASIAAAGALGAFFLTGPSSSRASAFWHPIATVAKARGPILISVDRSDVRRDDRVEVTVVAEGRRAASLMVRAPGEPWSASPLALDSLGRAVTTLGPLESDRFVRAASGGRMSETVQVRVALPAFLAELSLIAEYPSYLVLPDEPILPGPDTLLFPTGTRISVRGRSTVPLRSAGWSLSGGRSAAFATEGQAFAGALRVTRSGTWTLLAVPEGGGALEGRPPSLHIIAVRDSAPTVTVPVPGGDTTAPATLKQPLVVDVRDDHLVTRVQLEMRRVSRRGVSDERLIEPIPLPEEGAERLVLQWVLDLNGRGFAPGDTAHFRLRAFDNAPTPQMGVSPEYVLRLPTLAEMREAVRVATSEIGEGVDSLVTKQEELARAEEEMAAERALGEGGEEAELDFNTAERAGDLAEDQEEVIDRAEQLREDLEKLSEAAEAAGLDDPEFQRQLKDLERLLDRAMTPDLEAKLNEVREALENLDAERSRDAFEQLAESGRQFKEQLERSQELFERAAIEGSLTTLAEDAEDLANRQDDWNEQLGLEPDSSMALDERQLAMETDSLAARLDELQEMIEQSTADMEQPPDQEQSDSTDGRPNDEEGKPDEEDAGDKARQAAEEMQEAADEAEKREVDKARQAGEEASQMLQPMSQQLKKQRDELRKAWKSEVLGKMDHALMETTSLARLQKELADRLRRGESGAELRGKQAALKEGMEKIIQRLQQAAGKNALISPEISTALGLARLRMKEALERLQQPAPDTKNAATIAGQAVTGLNSVAYSLLQAREDVQSAGTGSGFSEAVERLAQMAGTQSAIAGQSGSLLPQIQLGEGEALLQQMRMLAERQRAVAEELERLDAKGSTPSGMRELSEEARRIARELEGGELNSRTVERQDKLFHRLLDAGRTLTGEEEDEDLERKSKTARGENLLVPSELEPGAVGAPRYRYPTWEELRELSPEERRLILDYFRRLNDAR